ncbi:hypothetical protein ACLK19_13115 [Escherichia coli]
MAINISLFISLQANTFCNLRSLRQARARQNDAKLLTTTRPATSCARKELLINPAA